MATTAFVTWRAQTTRRWYPIGRLSSHDGQYEFVYTRGAQTAHAEAGLEPLASFPLFDARYVSEELFPLFANRLLSRSRREYPLFVEWLSFPEQETDPVAILARSGGRRATDALEIFQCPDQDVSGYLRMDFFVHGLQHLSPAALDRAAHLRPSEPLLLMHDFQNPHDPNALMLRTAEEVPGDIHIVGYCPRYLLADIQHLIERVPESVSARVLRVNPPPAPIWFRLLCTLTAQWPEGYRPFSGPEYQPIDEGLRTIYMKTLRARSRDDLGVPEKPAFRKTAG